MLIGPIVACAGPWCALIKERHRWVGLLEFLGIVCIVHTLSVVFERAFQKRFGWRHQLIEILLHHVTRAWPGGHGGMVTLAMNVVEDRGELDE